MLENSEISCEISELCNRRSDLLNFIPKSFFYHKDIAKDFRNNNGISSKLENIDSGCRKDPVLKNLVVNKDNKKKGRISDDYAKEILLRDFMTKSNTIDKEKLSGGLDEVVRDLVEGESTEAEHKKLSLLPGRFVHNMRVVFIHRMVWDRIIDYRTKRCSSWDYFNESSWRLDPEKEVTEKIENLAELYEIERKLDSGEFADDDDGKWHMKLLRLSGSATNHVIQHEEAEHYFEFCKENNLDPMETLPKLIEIYKTAFTVSGFAMEINSHLKTRYAGQEGCEEEYGVLISMMQQRMQDVKDRYEE